MTEIPQQQEQQKTSPEVLKKRQQYISNLVKSLMFRNSGFAHLLKWVPRKAKDVDTVAYTDGKTIHVGNKFFTELKAQEGAFCVMHEVLHIAMRHPRRAKDFIERKDAMLWNIATDLIINHALGAENDNINMDYTELEVPNDSVTYSAMEEQFGFDIPKYEETENGRRGWSAENLFKYLKNKIQNSDNRDQLEQMLDQMAQQSGVRSQGMPGQQDAQGGSLGTDVRDFLGDLVEKDLGDPDAESTEDGIPGADDGNIGDNVWIKRFEQARGEDPSGALAELTGDLPAPKIDWREKLKRIVSNQLKPTPKKDPSRQNRRFQAVRSRIFVPDRTRERGVSKITVLHDASGSCWDEYTFKEFLKEIDAIHSTSMATINYVTFDADVESVNEIKYDSRESFKEKALEGSIEMSGGGGTSFEPPIRWLNENASDSDIAIMFTDTIAPTDDLPIPKVKFLWAVVYNDEFEPPFGDSVFISRDPSEV